MSVLTQILEDMGLPSTKVLEDALKPIHTAINRLEKYVSNLSSSVDALKAAVDTMAVRIASQVDPLRQALADAQSQLASLQTDDEAAHQALTTALAEADAATQQIMSEVDQLNALGAAPDQPVVPVPVEEIPAAPEPVTDDSQPPSDGQSPVESPLPQDE